VGGVRFDKVEAFYRPESVADAVRLLRRGHGRARVVAGGTDLVVEGDRSIRFLIDLSRAGLTYIRRRETSCAIGATTTLAELEESTAIRALAGGLLSQAAAACGSVQNRNMATVGGNLAHGSPAADLAPPLLVLDAAVVVADADGRHRWPLADYLAQPRPQDLSQAVLVEVFVPEPPHGGRCGWAFQKFGRTEVDLSLVNAAAGLQLDARGRVKWARLALGAVGPTAFRASAVEQLMSGREFGQALLAEAGEAVMRQVQPITDQRASAEFRRELSRVVAGRALEECAAAAGWVL
jgi:carbon-monoxide dehydrogenase medium subunit